MLRFSCVVVVLLMACSSHAEPGPPDAFAGGAKMGAMEPEKGPNDGPDWWRKNTPWVGGQVQQPYWPTTVLNGYALNYHTAVNNAVSFGNALGNGPEVPAVSVTPPGTMFNCASKRRDVACSLAGRSASALRPACARCEVPHQPSFNSHSFHRIALRVFVLSCPSRVGRDYAVLAHAVSDLLERGLSLACSSNDGACPPSRHRRRRPASAACARSFRAAHACRPAPRLIAGRAFLSLGRFKPWHM